MKKYGTAMPLSTNEIFMQFEVVIVPSIEMWEVHVK